MDLSLQIAIDSNLKSIKYAKVCLFTAWQVANAGKFESIFADSNVSYLDILQLEQKSYFVHQIVFTNWRMFVIEIVKIFDKNSSQGFNKIINKILFKEFGFRLGNYSKKDLQEFKNLYDAQFKSKVDIHTRLKTLRDKFYAHRDDEFFTIIDEEVKFSEGNELLSLAEEILTKIAAFNNQKLQFYSDYEIRSRTGVTELKDLVMSVKNKVL